MVIISGNTTGTNIFKGVLVQVGADLEEAARVSGAGWLSTYFKVVIPVLMPTMVLIGMLNFISAANTTSSIILLSSRETVTLSLLALEWGSADVSQVEAAGIVTLVIMAMTIGVALVMRQFALRVGLRQDMRAPRCSGQADCYSREGVSSGQRRRNDWTDGRMMRVNDSARRPSGMHGNQEVLL